MVSSIFCKTMIFVCVVVSKHGHNMYSLRYYISCWYVIIGCVYKTLIPPPLSLSLSVQVVEGSGWGWEHFGVRTEGRAGQVYAKRTLDYEDPAQRRGFRFMVQVTDRVSSGTEKRANSVSEKVSSIGQRDVRASVARDSLPEQSFSKTLAPRLRAAGVIAL